MITLTNTPISSMIPNCPRFTMDLLSPHLQDPIARFSSCPVLPPTPPFPSPEYPPLVVQEPSESTEIIQAIAIMNGIVVPPARAMSMEEAIEQNQLPVLAHWLQKNDKELAEH